jgi:pimeloyl-ACP methyl ester carboxylesterase
MPIARTDGIEIAYETFGPADGRPLLLIMGLAAQMILWDDEFCAALAARGHRVIRFDNRDVGLSTKLDAAGMPDAAAAMQAALLGERIAAPYLLRDLAADGVGLLDALGIPAAHVVGASMGGMIAQTMAITYPARVLSLTSIMSTTGERSLPPARPEAAAVLLLPAPADRAGNVERAVHIFRTIGSPGFPFDEARVRDLAGRSYDRCFSPAGAARQLVAILASGSRREALAAVTIPTLVIHGRDDPLIPLEAGLDTARAVPGAELLVIDGMGHDLPRAAWPEIVERIGALTARAA